MKKSCCGAMLLVVVGSMSASSVLAKDTTASVEKQIEASWAKVRTLSARTTFDSLDIGKELKLTSKFEGIYWHMKRDGKELFRYDVGSVLTMTDGKQVREQPKQKHILVADGEYVYNQTKIYGIPVADKVGQLESGISLGGKALLDYIKLDQYELKFIRSDKLDGQDVYVFEGDHAQVGKARSMICYISKESGMLAQRETYVKGKLNTRLTVSDVDLNEDLPTDIFDARPSPDIGIVDKTGKKAVMP